MEVKVHLDKKNLDVMVHNLAHHNGHRPKDKLSCDLFLRFMQSNMRTWLDWF